MLWRTSFVPVVSLVLFICGGCSGGGGGGGGADAGPGGDGGENPDGGSTVEVVMCDNSLSAPSSGVCDVTEGSSSVVVVLGDVLAPDAVYQNGAVAYEGDTITCVGCDCASAPEYASATRISCAGSAISPGLINPHDHLRWTERAPIDHGQRRYDHRHQWRDELSTPQNPHGTGQNQSGMRWGEVRQAMAGTTSLIGSGRALGMVRNLDDLTDAELERGFEEVEFETFSLGDTNPNTQIPDNCDWKYSATEGEVAAESAFLPHVAEGITEYAHEEFRCQSTSFDGGRDFTERNTAHIHSIGLTAQDYWNMSRDGARLIWSPRSNISLYGFTADVRLFFALDGVIALGTDWTYSGSATMVRELACAAEYNEKYLAGRFSDADLWKMATINAALATHTDQLIGSLEVGKIADIAVYSGGRFHAAVIYAGSEDVALVLRDGIPLFGETDVLQGLGHSCDPVDVCGTVKSVCVSREFAGDYPVDYPTLAEQVLVEEPAYPAIFCGPPANEPTCIPSRAGEFTGQPTADDRDGDGIPDISDNCSQVFNPARPMDGGGQPDSDADGIGDSCDSTPLLADLDADGVANTVDNCPFDANDNQIDGDEDNKGDVCDFCPTVANPLGICPAAPAVDTSIVAIQTDTHPQGTKIKITGAVVTAVWTAGAWVQDPTPGANQYAGVQVFTGGDPGVSIGDQVDVEGEVIEYHGDTEISDATITVTGSGPPIDPVIVSVADAATEPYEGMLVKVSDASTFVSPYDCSQDVSSCGDDNLWEIDGTLVVHDRVYLDDDDPWTNHIGDLSITGVMAYRFERRRIMPRSGSDFSGSM